MPKLAPELKAMAIREAGHPTGQGKPAYIAVGVVSGLLLQITAQGAKSWVLRYSGANGSRRKLGLGPFPAIGLAAAHEAARIARAQIRDGIDPIDARAQVKAVAVAQAKARLTFADAVDAYLDAKVGEFKNDKHRKQWGSTLTTYAVPAIGTLACADVGVQDVLRVLGPIWETKTETAKRLRGRIEKVLAWATVNGHRSGDNPARWRGNLSETLKKPSAIKTVRHQPMLARADVAEWFNDLKSRNGMSALSLQFAALTAARSGEVRSAAWSDIDLDKRTWTRPAEKMKMKRAHAVALSDAAVELLKATPRFKDIDLVFPAPRGGQLSDMSLSAVMRKINAARDGGYLDPTTGRPAVPHGLRATFRTWAGDETTLPREIIEHALAHKVGDDVENAYSRGDLIERRRSLMEQWACVLEGKAAGGEVVSLTG